MLATMAVVVEVVEVVEAEWKCVGGWWRVIEEEDGVVKPSSQADSSQVQTYRHTLQEVDTAWHSCKSRRQTFVVCPFSCLN